MTGNLCNASPAGDMLTPALVLGGVVEAISVEGTRQIPLKDFFLGVKRTALKENEMVLKIMFPAAKGTGKFQRRSRIKGHDLAQINVAAFVSEERGLKLALGAVAPVPVLLEGFEEVTRASLREEDVRTKIIDKVLASINPIGDQRASREYRIAMARYLTEQALISIAEKV
jgi:carbon-monoxide dehydrogenase medium subunit